MKQFLLLFACLPVLSWAQQDSVLAGSTHANDVYYSLENGSTAATTVAGNNWDLMLTAVGREMGVYINTVYGVKLWKPFVDTANVNWANMIDTVGKLTEARRLRNDYYTTQGGSYITGAFNTTRSPSSFVASQGIFTDLGWGSYNPQTRTTTGDSIYVIKTRNNDTLKLKFGAWSGLNDVPISIARLNGTNPQNLTLDRSTYSEKTHFFFDFSTNAAFSREPNKSDWDLLFTQIEDVVAPNTYYPFATVLTKKGLRVAEYVNRTNRDTRTDTTGMAFTTSPMTIGHDWKLFTPGAPGAPGTGWSYDDSTAYFVEDAGKDVWRIVFTFYSQGKYKFNKTKVIDRITSRGQATADNGLLSFGVGPNPATSYVDVVYELSQVQGPVRLQLLDLQGRVVQGYSLDARAGFFSHRMALDNVPNGLYLLQLQNGSYQASKRIVVQ